MRRHLGRVAAWAITAGLLFFLFKTIRFADVVAATRTAAPWTLPGLLACIVSIYLADSFAIWKTFGWFLAPLRFGQVLVVRGATYLLAAINYNVGQGAIVYFVHRVFGVPVMRGIATVLLVMGINVVALLFMATAGLRVAPAVPDYIPMVLVVAWAGLAVYALLVAVKPRWLATKPLFDVLLGAGFKGHARALLVRLPHIASLVTLHYTALHAFHADVPLGQAIVTLPIVFFISVLPISVQGLGVTQATMVFFFAQYAPGAEPAQKATVLAASLVTQTIATIFQVIVGLVCLRTRTGRELNAASKEAVPPPPAPAVT